MKGTQDLADHVKAGHSVATRRLDRKQRKKPTAGAFGNKKVKTKLMEEVNNED